MMILRGSAGSLNRETTCSSSSAPGVHFAQSGESPRDFDITIVETPDGLIVTDEVVTALDGDGNEVGSIEDVEVYAEELTRLYGDYAHKLLSDVFNDARTRLDARLSPDPIRQTIATVQTTVQDIWKTLTQTFNDPGGPPDKRLGG